MEINRNLLRKEISTNLSEIEAQILAIKKVAADMEIHPTSLRDSSGNFMLAPLLVSKASALHALVLLQAERK